MNEPMEDLDQSLLDKLVDGELSGADQRALLLQLDDTPHAWRRLALTFLEAQAWQRELRTVPVAVTPPAVTRISPPVVNARRHWSVLTTVATSVCVIFGLGFTCGSLRESSSPAIVERVAPDLNPPPELAAGPESGAEFVRVLVAGDIPGTFREVDLPLVEESEDGAVLLADGPSFIPHQVRRTLERMGHEVQEQRQLVPVQLSDGREAVVPVDDVHVRFVGQKSY
ncbi:MAG: hypothetical protein HZA46_08700 [Planctomycetales bacterium]|nr:hypothetical protein [Planctomycetales bacterium]